MIKLVNITDTYKSWNAENEALGTRALELKDGTGVPGTHTLPDDVPVDLDENTATEVSSINSVLEYIAHHDGEKAALELSDIQSVEQRYDELYAEHGDIPLDA